jgi:hypothetical protein
MGFFSGNAMSSRSPKAIGKVVFSEPIAHLGNNELAPPARAAVMTLRLLLKFCEVMDISSIVFLLKLG